MNILQKQQWQEKYSYITLNNNLGRIFKTLHNKLKISFDLLTQFTNILQVPFRSLVYPFSLLKTFLRPVLKDLLYASLALIFFLVFVPFFTYWVYADDLNNKEKIMNNNDTGVILLDRNDKPFFTFYNVKKKTFVPISEIPKQVQLAVVAIEDKEFYEHSGFSVRGIARSIYEDIKQQDLVSGGSTITQQLVKNSLLHPEKSFIRKYQEITLAYEIERRFSKDDILEMYLNSVYFGEGAFGVQEAAKTYFAKDVQDLTIAESAMLAAVLPAPSSLSPLSGSYDKARVRQELILERMVEQGYITQEQQQDALTEELKFQSQVDEVNNIAPHFALMVRDELIKKYGEENIIRSGYRVKTSLDSDLQIVSENVVQEQVRSLQNSRVSNGALVAIDPKTGEVLSLVGSQDWFNEKFGKVNVATSLRQPGSSFKPIVYAAAFEKGIITPATILKDSPITYKKAGLPPYKPMDYDRRFRGNVTVRRALANSLNIPSVEVLDKLGLDKALEMAHRLGISSLTDPSNYGLSLTLGSGEVSLLEMTQAYSVFANNGEKNDLTTILEITDNQRNIIYEHQTESEQVLKPEYAFLISSILSDSKTRAEMFGNELNISKPAAVKTGTSENYKDSLTIGYTPSFVLGVWVGNNDGTPMNTVAGSLGAAPIWKKVMESYLKDKPVETFDPPSNIETANICRFNGLPLKNKTATSSAMLEYFVKGSIPKGNCDGLLPRPSPSVEKLEEKKDEKQNQQEIRLDNGALIRVSVEGNKNVNINYGE